MSVFLGIGFGGTKDAEYRRTIEMLMEKTGLTGKEVGMMLYFLYDSQYEGKDLKTMAEIAIKDNRIK